MAQKKKIESNYPKISAEQETELLHILASCGFVGNQTRTANTHTPVNPPNLHRAFHDLKRYFSAVPAGTK